MERSTKNLPPNFRKFFTGEFKRLLNHKARPGTNPIEAIKDVMAKGIKAMNEDVKEKQAASEELESLTEDPTNVIKESGSKEPIR
tara:strand:- start:829 stop:1083 length:255 start_codon:yes stop_codon:yes gene_type:complete